MKIFRIDVLTPNGQDFSVTLPVTDRSKPDPYAKINAQHEKKSRPASGFIPKIRGSIVMFSAANQPSFFYYDYYKNTDTEKKYRYRIGIGVDQVLDDDTREAVKKALGNHLVNMEDQAILYKVEIQTILQEIFDKSSMIISEFIQFTSKAKKIEGNIAETKEIMLKNLDNIIARGEKIEALLPKTEELAANTVRFKREATAAKNRSSYCGSLFNAISSIGSYLWPSKDDCKYEFHDSPKPTR